MRQEIVTCDRCGRKGVVVNMICGGKLSLTTADEARPDIEMDMPDCCPRCYGGAYKLVETFAGKYRKKGADGGNAD